MGKAWIADLNIFVIFEMLNYSNVSIGKKNPTTFKCRHLVFLNDHYNVYDQLLLPFPSTERLVLILEFCYLFNN